MLPLKLDLKSLLQSSTLYCKAVLVFYVFDNDSMLSTTTADPPASNSLDYDSAVLFISSISDNYSEFLFKIISYFFLKRKLFSSIVLLFVLNYCK